MVSSKTWSADQRYHRRPTKTTMIEKSVRRRLAETEESDAQERVWKREG